MVLVAVSMVIVAALVLLGARATLGSSTSSDGSTAGNPEIAAADHLQAQQSLSTALQAASGGAASGGTGGIAGIAGAGGAAGAGGNGGGVSIAQLSAAEPSLTFVSGPTSSPTTVSVTTDPSVPGGVTLATRSADGVCWLVWHAAGTPTWYGAQTHLATCSAPALGSAPAAAPVSSTAIGWQTSSFPAA
jgi:hypothetical protein